MPEDPDKPVRFAIAHLFTTGRDPSSDSILHFACRRYGEDTTPQINDWIVNPERKRIGGKIIRKRVWIRTGISSKEAEEKLLWEEIQGEVLSFLEGVDMVFVRNSDVATEWFERVVYKERVPPPLVDLTEMYQFFLPEKPVPYSESALIDLGEFVEARKEDRRLHKVLNGMYSMLDSILNVILSRERNATGYHQPVYSLVDWALSAEGSQPNFEALFKVASVANNIRWVEGQIGGLSYDIPVKMEEYDLIQFIKDWKPSDLVEEDREPFDESLIGAEILDQDPKDTSTRKLLQSLRFVLSFADKESEDTEQLTNGVTTVENLLGELQSHVYKISGQLQYTANSTDPQDGSKSPANYEEFSSALIKLDKCMGGIEKELGDLLHGRLFSGSATDIPPRIRKQVEASLKRTRKLRRSLSDTLQPFLTSGHNLTDKSFRRATAQVLRQFPKIGHDYFTHTNPIQDEGLRLAYKLLLSDKTKMLKNREEQRIYSRFIKSALNTGGPYALEAGTGTGKTLGYLIPGCEHLRKNKERQVVVATATINLMDQIVTKEWTTLTSQRGSLYHDLSIAILKGKRNYLCISALKRLFDALNSVENKQGKPQRESKLVHLDDRFAWLYLFQVLTRKKGQWDNVGDFTKKYPRIAEKFEADLDAESACKPKLCRMGKNCSYPQAVRRAQFAHVLITNHHKLTKLQDEIQKRASVCIIDEADQFPDNLRSASSESLLKKDVMDFVRRVAGTRNRRGFVHILQDGLEKTQARRMNGAGQSFEKPLDILKEIDESCRQVKECLWNSTKESDNIKEKRWKELPLDHKNALNDILKDLDRQFSTIELGFRQILQFDPIIFRVEESEFFDRVNRYIYDAEEFGGITKSLVVAIPDNEFVVTYRQKSYDWTITKMPFSIANEVKNIMRSFETVVLTSATLYVDKTLNLLLLELLGDEESKDIFVADSKIMSPFNYDRQVRGASAPFIVEYNYRYSNEKWRQDISTTIALQSVALDGRTMVLFNSWNEMQAMYDCINPVLQKFEIPLLLQDRVGSSEAIIQEFAGLEESVLFGTSRFWSGVDFPGPTLSQLMIVRLPNKDLGNPLVKEREERWRRDTFWDLWYAQNTRRRLRQGFGRLIRKREDRGLFIVLDSRMVTHHKMIAHQKAIPVKLYSDYNGSSPLVTLRFRNFGKRFLHFFGIDL